MNNKTLRVLFEYARKSIESGFSNDTFRPASIPKELMIKRGVFVTLTINGRLRGCIGVIKPIVLWQGVISTAHSSAFDDPRFEPLSRAEFKQVIIEISILNKPIKSSYTGIKAGDGVIITKGNKNALFLPQVWTQLPDKKSFINELFIKAGLKPFEAGVSYNKFSVSAWEEESIGFIKPVNP
ncbi:MAG: AmmeMemoRadiSam system protein A [Candidatus Nanoarchaeia archaeon]|jgi:AmmeMemoRadiSam system protein A